MRQTAKDTFKYWLSNDLHDRYLIRIEWVDVSGRKQTTEGHLVISRYGDHSMKWLYDAPPESISETAAMCVHEDGARVVVDDFDVIAEFQGWETPAQMVAAVEACGADGEELAQAVA